MEYSYTEYSKILNGIFLGDYFKEYNSLRYKNKKKLLDYMSISYRRWYYSSFIEGTILTPSIIFQKLSEQSGDFTAPTIKYNKYPTPNDVSFVSHSYSLENHPVVDDLKIFLEACTPFVDLNEDDTLFEEFESTLYNSVSLQDKYYLDFLLDISIQLKLVKKMPAIYSNKAQTTAKGAAFFDKSRRVIFDKIFNATIEVAQRNISEIMPPHVNIFRRDYFLELLKKPIPTDYIFKSVYSSLGLNVDNFFNELESVSDSDLFEEMDAYGDFGNIMLSSTYLLGVLLDRYFLTPFGHYLKIISPFYFMPYQFEEDLRLMHDEMKTEGDMNASLWGPPSSYFLTRLGLEYFKMDSNTDNFLEIPDEVPLDDLISALKANSLSDMRLKILPGDESGKSLYEVKVKILGNKKIWFNVEIEHDDSLHQLHEEICDILYLDYDNEYSIYLDESESPFMQYVSPFSKKKMKKADQITLEALELKENQRLTYVMNHGTSPFLTSVDVGRRKDVTMRLEIEVLGVKRGNPKILYPFTSKKSKALMDLESDFNGGLPF